MKDRACASWVVQKRAKGPRLINHEPTTGHGHATVADVHSARAVPPGTELLETSTARCTAEPGARKLRSASINTTIRALGPSFYYARLRLGTYGCASQYLWTSLSCTPCPLICSRSVKETPLRHGHGLNPGRSSRLGFFFFATAASSSLFRPVPSCDWQVHSMR
jgi:hypothetical protein